MDGNSNLPFGVVLLSKVRGKNFGTHESRILVLLLTFTAYACFHASRKPLSIVKSVLDPEVSQNMTGYSESPGVLSPSASTQPPLSGWDPFNGDLGKARLGELDVAFLATYAAGMYYAGTLADRLDVRKFLTFGMVSSGACVCLFGFGYFWNIHSFWYYFTVQVITGLLSSIGWPVVVAIVANWFEKTNRGLIMGVWNAHASIGNIVGSVVAAAVLRFGWGWSFLLPGISLMLCALVVYCFLVAHPKLLGPSASEEENGLRSFSDDEGRGLLTDSPMEVGTLSDNFEGNQLGHALSDTKFSLGDEHAVKECLGEFDVLDKNDGEIAPCSSNINEEVAVQFLDAWNIPGVAVYAFCLFFVKLVAYTFLYWLPFYIRHTKIGGTYLSDKMAGYLSVIFDIGGVIGGIIAGHLSDKCNVRALIAVVFIYCAVPSLYAFRSYGGISLGHAVGLMLLSGIFVNGPYALITTAVSADLGTDSSLKGNAKALATVTAIIDGTGSVGAAIGPFITGYISLMSWTAVFIMLAISLLIAGIFLVKLVIVEVKEKMHLYQSLRNVEVQLELSDMVPA
ncbi:hypothetical protein KP509_22G002800 [Ceratopteris richardii]|uniref:Major facilitator superfamily (MFS) profile domain-containing protein n=1 Tax=Ceratopteris richardii TaxID=49495 RepID=A0A8T2S5D5_CERRI|nr:hypothetical protein KP509_22G002800 [Ceratopteris richardii]